MTAALDLLPDDEVKGTKYVVVRKLSSGGHGTIYLVRNRDLPSEKRFALKILSANHGSNADLSARLLREAHLQACIDHPNVVAVYDAGMTSETPSRAYLLMERLRGENLAVMIQNAGPSGLGLASIYGVGIQVCDALECAHERGAIHRDIKPDNIFIHRGFNEDSEAVTKVLDFGVAYFMGMVQRRSGEMAIGTPMYMAPEQLRGERPTPRTDVYALGLVLYEMVTGGKRPFRCNTFAELARAHLTEVPPPPSQKVDVEVPSALEQLIMQMLAKDPSDRPPTARFVGSKLREMKQSAELEYRGRSLADINQTDETPFENILMATRAPETSPTRRDRGELNQTLPGTPKAKGGVSAQSAANDRWAATVPGMDLPPLDGQTLETVPGFDTAPLPVHPTAPLDLRAADTRSLPQRDGRSTRTDTDELPPASSHVAPSRPVRVREVGDRFVAVEDTGAHSIRPAAGGRAPTTTAGSAGVLLRSATGDERLPIRSWRKTVGLGALAAVLVVGVFFGVRVASHASRQPSTAVEVTSGELPALPAIPATTEPSAASSPVTAVPSTRSPPATTPSGSPSAPSPFATSSAPPPGVRVVPRGARTATSVSVPPQSSAPLPSGLDDVKHDFNPAPP